MNRLDRDKLLNDALDAVREALSDAESCGHPLGGRAAARKSRDSHAAAEAAIRALAVGVEAPALPPCYCPECGVMEDHRHQQSCNPCRACRAAP
ncbi:MAG TPA: hypothetical protein VLK85_07630 [Ramlibacter sp.]|nr:hypothetical protein [Ramlibacter sp.]